MRGEENDGSRYAMIFVRDITEARKEMENILELTRKNDAMDLLLQGTMRLVNRFAMCNLEDDTYKFYSLHGKKPPYDAYGTYHDLIRRIASRYKVVAKDETIDKVISADHIRGMIRSMDDIYKLEYCTEDEKHFKSMAFIPLSWKDGVLEKVLLIAQDTTQEKLAEIESRIALKEAYEAANKANRSKTEFLSNMSHDIRTPMNAIVGMTAIAGATVAILNEIGIDGEWVLSGKEAVERAVKRHENGNDYFVYIIDWQMPGMDGIETTRQIRQKIGPDVSVIVLTSYDYTKIEEEAKAAGVDEFISKPLFRSRLTAALQNIISGKPSQDARNYLKNIAASDYTGKKILLVEDNELNREVAAEIIGMTGAEIETAVNGKEAVDKVADHPNGYYDLVFMDVQMPIMNGYEAATAIRSLPKHKGDMLPIIAMTANAFTEDVILAKSAGMNEHIAKPLDMEKLNRMLHEWM